MQKLPKRASKPQHFDKDSELKVAGVNAVKVAFAKRPQDVIKFYVTEKNKKDFHDIMSFCVKNKKAYHIVADNELEKVTGSLHHEGVALLMKKKASISIESFLKSEEKQKTSLILALENVQNPHNLGAIMRSAAHFGVKGLLVTMKEPAQTSSAYRTAEGGAEAIDLIETKNLKASLEQLKKNGYTLMATSGHAKDDLYQTKFSSKVVLVMGEERKGLSSDIMKLCQNTLKISGTEAVESLNVSVATALIMGEFWRQTR